MVQAIQVLRFHLLELEKVRSVVKYLVNCLVCMYCIERQFSCNDWLNVFDDACFMCSLIYSASIITYTVAIIRF